MKKKKNEKELAALISCNHQKDQWLKDLAEKMKLINIEPHLQTATNVLASQSAEANVCPLHHLDWRSEGPRIVVLGGIMAISL